MALRIMKARRSDPGGGSLVSNCGTGLEFSDATSLAITLNLSKALGGWTVQV
jgi:hypothetical protein